VLEAIAVEITECARIAPSDAPQEGPYLLRERLGHLDPTRIAAEPERVAEAVRQPPALQRFVNTVSEWLVAAARRVLADYGGDAGAIWRDEPTARELQARFDRFEGIGQKKAAMATAILARDLKVPIRELEGADIAYDVHIRRVFLRTGITDRDDVDVMVTAARRLNPSNPSALDEPAWLIGRQFCRPGAPLCPSCPLEEVCPKLVAIAAGVTSA
jgi:endonuclease III